MSEDDKTMQKEKDRYVTPVAIPLGELARGMGQLCSAGSTVTAPCSPGSVASGGCADGSSATGTCGTGYSPSGSCDGGSLPT